MKFLSYLKGLAEGYALSSVDSDFEVKHLADVTAEIVALAKARGLELETALAIAYGHDLGRLMGGVSGKGHAKAGSKLMKSLLKESDFTPKQQRRICRAIGRHNQKDKVHGAYAELIKDADSLAHHQEGLVLPKDHHEVFRVLAATAQTGALAVKPFEDWRNGVFEGLDHLKNAVLDQAMLLARPGHWVHEVRVAIRKLRSLLWLFKGCPDTEMTNRVMAMDEVLKDMAKGLERPRFLQVLLAQIGKEHPSYKFYRDQLDHHYELIRSQTDWTERLNHLKLESEGVLSTFEKVCGCTWPCNYMEGRSEKLISRFFDLAKQVSTEEPVALHRLRIQAKRIKYLSQMGLIALEPPLLVTTVNHLHHMIGEANDLVEISQLFEDEGLQSALENWRRQIENELFLAKMLDRQFK